MTTRNMETVAARIVQINAEIERLNDEKGQLAEAILALIPAGEKAQAGDYLVTVKQGMRRLNTKKLAEMFPAEQFPQMYEMALSTKLAKKEVSEAYLEANDLYTYGKPTVSVK